MSELKNLNILIAEDEEDLRDLLIEVLNSSGALCTGAPNGNVAYELLQQKRYDVLITDVRMPGGDGISLIKKINEHFQVKPKVFICSAFNDMSPEESKKLGVLECFPKPFDFNSIIESIRKAF